MLSDFTAAFEISQLLECGLDKECLSILVALCENDINSEALVTVVYELRREAAVFRGELN